MISKKYFVLTVLVFLLTVPAAAQTEKKVMTLSFPTREREFNPQIAGKPEQQLETAEHKLSDAFIKYDVKALDELLADDLEVMGLTASNVKKSIIDLANNAQKVKRRTGPKARLLVIDAKLV